MTKSKPEKTLSLDMYDYLIIGAGSAGCVVANRLSQDPTKRVLLLEAGKVARNPLLKIPLFGPAFGVGNPKYDWMYRTQADPSRMGMQQDWPRGKLLGGSSRINGMVYVRGAPHDFDDWATSGCKGWGWSDVEPYFRKFEKLNRLDGIHGQNGSVKLHRLRRAHPLTRTFIRAHEALGYTENNNYNGTSQAGTSVLISGSNGWWRSSGLSSYISPIKKRPNLTVLTQAYVSKIIFDQGKAKAVEYKHKNTIKRNHSRGEIILCAGAIETPVILMRSGIGPAQHLSDVGITVLKDSPQVGQNLHEHPAIQIVINSKHKTINSQNKIWHWLRHVWEWARYGGGLMSAASYEAISFIHSSPDVERPDIQLHFSPYGLERTKKGLKPTKDDTFMIQLNLSYPKSRGQIKLNNQDTKKPPLIYAPMFAVKDDIDTLKKATKLVFSLCEGQAFKADFGGYITLNVKPDNDLALEEALLRYAVPAYHPAGTCRMGADEESPVCPKLKLKNITGLRVVDASVIPQPISGNIHATVLMIAEKASDLIANDHCQIEARSRS